MTVPQYYGEYMYTIQEAFGRVHSGEAFGKTSAFGIWERRCSIRVIAFGKVLTAAASTGRAPN